MMAAVLPPEVVDLANEWWPLIVIVVVIVVLVWVNHRLQRRLRRITDEWSEHSSSGGRRGE